MLLPPRERSSLEAEVISETKGSRLERERLLQKAINSLSEDDQSRWLEINTKALEHGLLKSTDNQESQNSAEIISNSNQNVEPQRPSSQAKYKARQVTRNVGRRKV